MSNEEKKAPNDKAPAPIRVGMLLIVTANPAGIRVPNTKSKGGRDHFENAVLAGPNQVGDVRTDIEYRPWMRHHRVVISKRTTRTENGKEVESWAPDGEYFIHETMAVWSPLVES